jgi:hypothetical protein
MDEQSKINAALDAALDELDSDDDEDSATAGATPARRPSGDHGGGIGAPPPSPASPEALLESMVRHMMVGGNEEDFMGRMLGEMEAHIRSEVARQELTNEIPLPPPAGRPTAARTQSAPSTHQEESPSGTGGDDNAAAGTTEPSSSPFCDSGKRKHTSPPAAVQQQSQQQDDLDDVIGTMFADIRSRQANLERKAAMEGLNYAPPSNLSGDDDDDDANDEMLQNLMKGLERLDMTNGDGDDLDADTVLDGMMEQLLSKDLMYQPMKQVADRFPLWLEENKARLSADDYAEYVLLVYSFDRVSRHGASLS